MSSVGQGSLSVSQKNSPSGAPFPANAAFNGLSVDPVTGQIVLGNDFLDPAEPAAIVTFRHVPFQAGTGIRWGAPSPGGAQGQGNFEIGLLYGPPGGSHSFVVEGSRAAGQDANIMAFSKTEFLINDNFGGGPRNCLTVEMNAALARVTTDLPFFTAQDIQTGDPGFATGAGTWALGDIVVAAAVMDGTQYLEVNVSGTMYRLALIV